MNAITKKIILDTNALMDMVEFKIDLFAEIEKGCDFPYEIEVLQGTMDELENIAKTQRGKFRAGARLARAMVEQKSRQKKVTILPETENVDHALAQHSRDGDLVLTQDQELKRRLTKPYLTIRQKKKVVLIR